MTTNSNHSRLIVGLGCSSSASADEVVSLVEQCLAEARRDASDIVAFATHVRKHGSVALLEVAAHYGVPLRFLDDDELAPGIEGTCEAVASAAGKLLLGKRKSPYGTCAIALCSNDFALDDFGQPARPSAVMASSTLATSLAGP